MTSIGTEISDRVILVMNGMRKKRHRIVYEVTDIVPEDEEQAVKWAMEFVDMIEGRIHSKERLPHSRACN